MTGSAAGSRRPPSRVLLYTSLVLYQITYLLVFCFFLVWRLLFDRRYRRGIRQRFGFVPQSASDRRVVWIHGVSVGEVKAAGTLISELRRTRPDLELVISSTTPTGNKLARDLYPDRRVIFYPLDLGPCPAIALRRIRPICVLLMELEVWPNFLHAASGLDIPVAVINGRISEQSFRGYRLARALLPQFHLIEMYCMQDEVYRQRLLELRVDPQRATVTGNMKYDNVRLEAPSADSKRIREWLSPDDRPVIVCGSTHPDEELWLAQHIAEVAQHLGSRIRVVVAPRHPERAPGVRDTLAATGVPSVMWSREMHAFTPLHDEQLVIVDTIGHLEKFYGACDVAFIGGSLVPRGGQNMMEAAAMGKAVMFGPHVSNFRKDVQLLLEADAACQVEGRGDLAERLLELLEDPGAREGLGARAVALIQRNQGSTGRTLERLEALFDRADPGAAAPPSAPADPARRGGR